MRRFEQLATPPWLYLNSSPYPYKKALASATSSLLFVLDTCHTHCDLKSPVSTEERKQRLILLISVADPESKLEPAAEALSTFTVERRRSTFTDERRRSPGGRSVCSAMTTISSEMVGVEVSVCGGGGLGGGDASGDGCDGGNSRGDDGRDGGDCCGGIGSGIKEAASVLVVALEVASKKLGGAGESSCCDCNHRPVALDCEKRLSI